MGRLLDDATLRAVAGEVNFHLDVDFRDRLWPGESISSLGYEGTNIVWGTGVADIDRAIDLMAKYPNSRYRMDIGVGGTDSSWAEVSADDMRQFRTFFIARWGAVDRVSLWLER